MPNNAKKTILIIDDHSIILTGIEIMLSQSALNVFCDDARNGKIAIEKLMGNRYEMILLDINLPDTDSYNLVEQILSIQPEVKILVFSMNPEEIYAKRYLKMGAFGYLNKEASKEQFIHAVQTVLGGGKFLSEKLKQIISEDVIYKRNENVFDKLTKREFELMCHLVKGVQLHEIYSLMNIHSSTVGTHKAKIFEKTGVTSVLELRDLALLHKIITV